MYNGRVTFVELETETGVLSPQQKIVHSHLTEAFCATFVCRSVEDVEAALRTAGVPVRVRGS